MSENTQDQLPAPVDFAQIDQEEYQNRQADRIAAVVFNGEDRLELSRFGLRLTGRIGL